MVGVLSERALGRGHAAALARIDLERDAQRPRQPLEAALGDMVGVVAVERLDMQRDAGIHREGLEELAHQLGVEAADLLRLELRAEDQEGPAGDVDRDARQRLVHRQMHVGVTADALLVAERLLQRLAERDAGILDRMVVVDMGVALHR